MPEKRLGRGESVESVGRRRIRKQKNMKTKAKIGRKERKRARNKASKRTFGCCDCQAKCTETKAKIVVIRGMGQAKGEG